MYVATDDGVELHVQEMGHGPPMVMLHGLLVGNMTTWYWTAAPPLARSHRVILFDLRGHGRSGRPREGYDVERMTGDLASVIDKCTEGSAPVALVGHSYGGIIALRFALDHPTRVSKIAVVEAPLPPSSLTEIDAFIGRAPADRVAGLPDALLRGMSGGRRGARALAGMRFLAEDSSLVRDLQRAEDLSDDALRTLRCPLLAVYGTTSSCRASGQRLLRLVPDARLTELSGGHFLPLESPRALTDTLTRFFDA